MKIMALDIGDARIGIALTDPLGMIASPLEVYRRRRIDDDIGYIAAAAKRLNAELIVIGLPVNSDGVEGDRARLTRDFGERLKRIADIAIDYEDESYTTVEAEESLIEQGLKWKERKKIIDMVAAAIILRSYLDRMAKIK